MEVRQRRVQGNATVEVIVALLAVSPFLVGIPLLGKQLDVKHKAYDAARYSAWERTVWSNVGTTHRKTDDDIYMESRDRVLGDPRSGLIPAAALREQGTGENALWRDGEMQSTQGGTPRAAAISSVTLAPGSTPPWPGLAPWLIFSSMSLTCGSRAFSAKRSGLKVPSSLRQPK